MKNFLKVSLAEIASLISKLSPKEKEDLINLLDRLKEEEPKTNV
jgi:hypothetical protein|tara:strand:+ start:250 stop:381 length:132 start_codon:yes stop_codon:yes gene_type:complete